MSIFGNIQNGVFSGFGKPYIKLEFDDNTALLDFQKRMNESGEAQESEFEDGEFRPIEGIKDYLKADLKEYAEPFVYKRLNKTNILDDFGKGEPFEFKQDIKIYKVNTPIGVVYLTTNQWDKLTTKEREKYFGLIKPTLTRPLYILKEDNNRLCFAKTFSDGNKIILFYSVVGDFGNIKNGSITNFEKRKLNDIITKIESGDVRYISPTLKTRLQTTASTSNTPLVAVGTLLNGLTFENVKGLIFDEKNLGATGDVYLVTDTRKNPRKELDETAAFKKIDIEKFNVNALKALQDSDPILYEEIKAGINEKNNSDLGKTANPYLYNNNEIIDCRGLKPTYKILENYDNFFDVADTKTSFAGFGLTDTKKLISETCRAHWKDCKKIAAHLKGDSLLQSCFNLWHWLRFNIRYEYDKEGREEIRTPLRVWHDRARGVDCDCLSVFSWCVLRCMGYDPVFELVAFKNRPQFSHIFINCDGVVVDRVWFVFNSRPPLVTKRELFRVDLINNLGQLF